MQKEGVSRYIGRQIKKYRLLKGLTQKELGMMVKVKHNTISSYESGVNRPEGDTLFAIAKALGISIDDLFPSTQQLMSNNDAVNEDPVSYLAGPIDIVMLPVVGRISCGNGVLAYEDIDGYEPTPKNWIAGGEYFYLRAKGDSMTGARISEGDLLLIRKQPIVENGEIAAVMIGEEAVLKRVYKKGNQLILQSENPNYQPILAPPAEAHVVGKLKKIVISV